MQAEPFPFFFLFSRVRATDTYHGSGGKARRIKQLANADEGKKEARAKGNRAEKGEKKGEH